MKNLLSISLIILVLGCSVKENFNATSPEPNPASIYCESEGGTFTFIEYIAACDFGERICTAWPYFESHGTNCTTPLP